MEGDMTLREYKKIVLVRALSSIIVVVLLACAGYWYANHVISESKNELKKEKELSSRLQGQIDSVKDNKPASSCDVSVSEVKPQPVVAPVSAPEPTKPAVTMVDDKKIKKYEREIKELKRKLNFCQGKRVALWEELQKEKEKVSSVKKDSDSLDVKAPVDQQETLTSLCNFRINGVVVDSKKFPLVNSELRCKNWTDLEAQKRGLIPVSYSKK